MYLQTEITKQTNLLNGKFHYLKEPLFFGGVGDYYVSYYLICKHAVRVGLWMEMKVY